MRNVRGCQFVTGGVQRRYLRSLMAGRFGKANADIAWYDGDGPPGSSPWPCNAWGYQFVSGSVAGRADLEDRPGCLVAWVLP